MTQEKQPDHKKNKNQGSNTLGDLLTHETTQKLDQLNAEKTAQNNEKVLKKYPKGKIKETFSEEKKAEIIEIQKRAQKLRDQEDAFKNKKARKTKDAEKLAENLTDAIFPADSPNNLALNTLRSEQDAVLGQIYVKRKKLEEAKTETEKITIKEEIKNLENRLHKTGERIEHHITIDQIVELLKNQKIDEIIVSGKEIQNKKTGEKMLIWEQDLDTKAALYILNNLNTKSTEETYGKNAKTTLINTRKREKIPDNQNLGFRLYIDAGGEWIKLRKGKEETTVWLDHHGKGQKEATSGTKMIYQMMKKGEILKNTNWLEEFVSLVTNIDNLSYLKDKNEKGEKTFTPDYFKSRWPYSLVAIAEKIPFDDLIYLIQSKKITNLNGSFSKKEIEGELGKFKLSNGLTIKELCENTKNEAFATINGIQKANKINTSIGKIVFHDFKNIGQDTKTKKPKSNKIPNKLGFIGATALGFDGYATWNKIQKTFYINSNNENLSVLVTKINQIDPGCAIDVRGVMVFGKITEKIDKKTFLKILTEESEIKKTPRNTDNTKKDDTKNKTEEKIKRIEELKTEIINAEQNLKDQEEKIQKLTIMEKFFQFLIQKQDKRLIKAILENNETEREKIEKELFEYFLKNK